MISSGASAACGRRGPLLGVQLGQPVTRIGVHARTFLAGRSFGRCWGWVVLPRGMGER